jgi:hypothetical protein
VLLLKILAILILLLIFFQDWKSRAVYWFLFPALIFLLMGIRFLQPFVLTEIGHSTLMNIGFIVVQLCTLTLYFSFRNKKWINITAQLLGLGDILFLLSIACYLSVLNFLFFYTASLIIVLLVWLSWNWSSKEKNKFIPLAGFQSLIFILFLASDWWLAHFNVTDDTWLLNLITK